MSTQTRLSGPPRAWSLRRLPAAVAAVVLLAGTQSCGSQDAASQAPPAAPKTVTVTETATPTPEPDPQRTEPTEALEPDPGSQVGGGEPGDGTSAFTMPNEVGKVLQAAQDDLQAVSGNPFFYSDSIDATGQARFQALDSGWQVCKQNKRPGVRVDPEDQSIVFHVVRVSEQCP